MTYSNMFGQGYEKKRGFGIFQVNWTCIIPLAFKGFVDFMDFEGCQKKLSEQPTFPLDNIMLCFLQLFNHEQWKGGFVVEYS